MDRKRKASAYSAKRVDEHQGHGEKGINLSSRAAMGTKETKAKRLERKLSQILLRIIFPTSRKFYFKFKLPSKMNNREQGLNQLACLMMADQTTQS